MFPIKKGGILEMSVPPRQARFGCKKEFIKMCHTLLLLCFVKVRKFQFNSPQNQQKNFPNFRKGI